MINIWRLSNTETPTETLIGEGVFTKACIISNIHFNDAIVCGTKEGMILVWDLRNTGEEIDIGVNSPMIRKMHRPCFQTDFMESGSKAHLSSIIELISVKEDEKHEVASSQLVSLDEDGIIILWWVTWTFN